MIHFAQETTSTNDDAKIAAREGAKHGELFIAESQTRGRGRQGRTWISARGENLLFSVLLRLRGAKKNHPLVALAAGMAVRDAVARALPKKEVKVKWPNDVLVGDGKIAGILVESANCAIVVGIGVNVHARAFPPGLTATSVSLEGEEPPSRVDLLVDILEGIDRDAPIVVARGLGLLHARLRAADALEGRTLVLEDGRTGVAEGIDLDGRLRVRTGGALVHLASGEVRIVERGHRRPGDR